MLSANRSAPTSAEHARTGDARYFLIVFDPKAQEITDCHEFVIPDEAETALIDAERAYRESDVQVVMFQAKSYEDLKRTHPHYFEDRASDTAPFPTVQA